MSTTELQGADTTQSPYDLTAAACAAAVEKVLTKQLNMDTTQTKGLMTTKEVAKYLSISERMVHYLKSSGKIGVIRIGGAIRYTKESIDAFLHAQMKNN